MREVLEMAKVLACWNRLLFYSVYTSLFLEGFMVTLDMSPM